ncbi:MAG: DUF1801 domain-containing protein [Chloroflexi bacterium]|nr:DUF1801 domain-containing protein [Chloroflexota bacterium]
MSKPKPDRDAPQEVDEYLAAQAPAFRAILEQLRALIKAVAPDCAERVSYKIPIFRLKQDFIAMSAAKKHCGLHTMSKAIPTAMKDELNAAGIRTSGTTLHIKTGSDLPVALSEQVLQARLAELEADSETGAG